MTHRPVFFSISTNTGFRLFLINARIGDIIVNVGTITSEPAFIFNDRIATSKAVVPLLIHELYFLFINLLNFSNLKLKLPLDENHFF